MRFDTERLTNNRGIPRWVWQEQEPRDLPRSERMSASPCRVAILLVNYRRYASVHLPECYESLLTQDFPMEQVTLLICDNASTPQSRGEIERIAPTARLFPAAENLGWAGGNNACIQGAMTEGVRYFITLNMDTRLEPDWLRRLIEKAQRNPALHILQSKMLLYGTDRINSLGGRIQYLGYGYCSGYGEADPPQRALAIDFASGAAMLVKREVFEQIGLFRDEYFMYCEDMEFCWRARLAGFNVGLADQSICHHKHDPVKTLHSIRFVERNRWLTLLTLEEARTLLLLAPCLVVSELLLWAYVLCHGWVDIPLRTVGHLLRPSTWRWIRTRRREVKAFRQRSDKAIVGQFASALFVSEAHPFFRMLMNRLLNPLLSAYWAIARRLIPGRNGQGLRLVK